MNIYVRGVGATAFGADARSVVEMVYEAVARALADAGVARDDLDYVVTSGLDIFDGKVASNVLLAEVTGSVMRAEVRVASDGAAAVFHAAALVAAGKRNVLVVAACKNSETDADAISRWFVDPVFMQPLGLGDLEAAALQAGAWLASGGSSRDASALAAARRSLSVEAVEDAPFLCRPIRAPWRAPLADGAMALVLSAEGRGSRAQLAGAGLCVEPHYLGDRDLVGCPALGRAAKRALRQAGASAAEIDLAEISAPFAHQEILWRRALGLGERTAVNPSGGWFDGAGTPYAVAGLARIARAYESVAGGRARTALAHGAWGPAGQGHAVIVVRRAA